MEAVIRKPFQGITNIVRFNWHFYVIAVGVVISILVFIGFFPTQTTAIAYTAIFLIVVATLVSLAVSFYVYDLSGLYQLKWLDDLELPEASIIVNINAGFDETSYLLQSKFPSATLKVFDFYDPIRHTEVSIKRARKAYAAFDGTRQINTSEVFLSEDSADLIFLILAAHEIRNQRERESFFSHLRNALKENGRVIVVEHLRDVPNFLAYTVGFFHFYSGKNWKNVFERSGFAIAEKQNITPFIAVFSLQKNGTAS